ncbi:flagellar L-ring protein [Ferrigenium kumadai]|uniref:Flagellar L-ring protein n=1 Tax=Ferrigenium kumadai TaxID=1682490 RepID=A0AAN1W015_9PROT|nr:flagellar basal body L-ring protein FlgH [Ferrigenium kumadai]BBI98762.1 flagellar L-ring protein [Ferrigenium kumadai]
MRNLLIAVSMMLMLAGCAAPSTNIQQPMTARPVAKAPVAYNDGAIFHAGQNQHPLFEDYRARNVGDTITINIVEKTSANDKSSASANHSSTLAATTPSITRNAATPKLLLTGMTLSGSTGGKYADNGASTGAVDFTGTITVTVIEVLSNGNLLVSGEKQVAVNTNNEYIRFSGVVNPTTIAAGNTVQSTQVADAHLEYKGRSGVLDTSSVMNVLGRLFLSVLPF